MEGYAGKVLEIDLSSGKIGTLSVKEDDQKKFIGGSGLAAKIFFDSFDPMIDPLSSENPLILMTGPLVGTQFPGTSRFAVCGKSPLTGIWGEGTCRRSSAMSKLRKSSSNVQPESKQNSWTSESCPPFGDCVAIRKKQYIGEEERRSGGKDLER